MLTIQATRTLVRSFASFTALTLALPTSSVWSQPAQNPNTAAARQAGLLDGRPGGEREGRERGTNDGYRRGFDKGEDEAYRERINIRRRDAYNFGYQGGYVIGERRGQQEGDYRGRIDGDERGKMDGRQDGERRAESDATTAATPPGRQKGSEEANASDAPAQGREAGLIAGDRQAQEKANSFDYSRGRKDYRDEQFAEDVRERDEFSQKGPQSLHDSDRAKPAQDSAMEPFAMVSTTLASPDYRYLNCPKTFVHPQETQAYSSACREGYQQGFQAAYNQAYRDSEQNGLRDGRDRGRRRADQVDVRPEYDRGYIQGEIDGYRRAFDLSYDQSFRAVYPYAFQQASAQAYSATYQSFYDRAFEAARASAYRERFQELYNQAFESSRKEKFDAVYPGYAREAYQRGRADEAREFDLNPLRLIDAQLSKEFASGLFEPGEALRFVVDVRNFSTQAVNPQDVSLTVEALDAKSAVLTVPQTAPIRGFKPKSQTKVKEALEFRMNETAIGRANAFVLKLHFKGRVVGEKSFEISPKFMLRMQFAEDPTLREGVETVITVKVTNQSKLATGAGTKVEFLAQSDALRIIESEQLIPTLAPAETREIAFRVVGKRPGEWVRIPMAFIATLGSGRRVGVFDITDQVPIINDYSIEVLEGLDRLRQVATTRVEYRVKNQTSRLVLRSLQLHTRVKRVTEGEEVTLSEKHVVLGPNPQYLTPILRGFEREFLVPIMVTMTSHENLVLEMEVQEEGHTVVVHRRVINP